MKPKENINGVIFYKPSKKILEDSINKFSSNLQYGLGYPLGYFMSKKYVEDFKNFSNEFPRKGKIINDNTIEFNSFDHAFYDMKVLKKFTKINLNLSKHKTSEFFINGISCLTVLNDKPSTKWVIGFHGWTENKFLALRLTDGFLAKGYNVLTFDSYAHALSIGETTDIGYTTATKFVDAIINYLYENYEVTELGMIGNSMGASTITFWASTCDTSKVTWAVADCGFASLLEQYRYVMQYRYNKPWWLISARLISEQKKTSGFNLLREYDSTKKLNNCKLPILFAHGTGDMFVPVFMSKKMYKKQNNKASELYLAENVDHCKIIKDKYDEYIGIIDKFIERVRNEK